MVAIIRMTKQNPWDRVAIWIALWDDDWDDDLWFDIIWMYELFGLLEIDPYPSSDEETSDSDQDEREYPVINPYEMDPTGGQDWTVSEKGDIEKT